MKKTFLILLISISTFSCKSLFIDLALTKIGVYDDKINLLPIENNNKEVVFFPMHHIGTEMFYEDVNKKIDSLKNKGFYFYFEKVKIDKTKDTILRKFRKISNLPILNNDYLGMITSRLGKKGKFKKKLVNQPTYKKLGLDSLNSKNVDVSLIQIIDYYEKKYGKIKLETCDYETSVYEKTICVDEKISEEIKNKIIIDYRNNNVVNELQKDKRKKIVIIYGKNHFKGINEQLFNLQKTN